MELLHSSVYIFIHNISSHS